MKQTMIKKTIVTVLYGITMCSIPENLFSQTASTSSTSVSSSTTMDECSKELLLTYFPRIFVNETLKKFDISADKWEAINKALTEKDKEVINTVEEKASKITPNPLKDPQQRQTAIKIFRETLLQLFSEVMKANGIADDSQIQAMLDDIQKRKAERFAQCMEKQRGSKSDNDNDNNNNNDNDEDEDEDDSEDEDSDQDEDDSDKDSDTSPDSSSSTSTSKTTKDSHNSNTNSGTNPSSGTNAKSYNRK